MNEKQRLILKIMHLAYLVHEFTSYCVFIDFSGHVDQLGIRVRRSKDQWEVKVLESEFLTAYSQLRKVEPPEIAELKAKIEVLEEILVGDGIPFDELDYEEEYSRYFRF